MQNLSTRQQGSSDEREPNKAEEVTTPLLRIKWVELQGNPVDARQLTFCELDATMPFDVKRVYWLHCLFAGEVRGQHAHRETQQLLVATSGRILIKLDDGADTHQYLLDDPTRALWVPCGLWRDIVVLDGHSVLLSMASTHFDEADYIRDYSEFQVFAREQRIKKIEV